jgi:hypothetical protein
LCVGAGIPSEQAPERASAGDYDVSGELACSEQLPSPSRQPPASQGAAEALSQPAEPEAANDADAAVMIGREGVPKGMSLMPPDEATMASALSVWKGQKKPLCDFLLSEYRNQPVARSDCLMSLTPFFAAPTVTVLGLHLASALQ